MLGVKITACASHSIKTLVSMERRMRQKDHKNTALAYCEFVIEPRCLERSNEHSQERSLKRLQERLAERLGNVSGVSKHVSGC